MNSNNKKLNEENTFIIRIMLWEKELMMNIQDRILNSFKNYIFTSNSDYINFYKY